MKIQKKVPNKILKKLLLDTVHGDRSFLLLQGDLLQDEGDVIVITIHDQGDSPQGDLYDLVKEKFDIDHWHEKEIYFLGDHGWIGEVHYEHREGRHNPVILTLHTGLPEGTIFEITAYEKYVKGTFAALAALEFEGRSFRELALPVLIRKGLEENYEEAIQCLIKHATSWLKSSKCSETIKYYIHKPEDAMKWEESMESVLSRTYVSYSKAGIVDQLRKEVLTVIDTYKKEEYLWREVLSPLRNSLSMQKDRISPDTKRVARSLAEVIVKLICEKQGIPFHLQASNLTSTIETLKRSDIIPELAAQYLHVLRTFGNKKSHIDNSDQFKYPIRTLGEDDEILLLSTILRSLRYYANISKK
ncbi:hypothetical protein COI93_04320 [Bacillus cereus]|uniref:DUF4145 domain-containing protein n=1 Tax=Bacillus cereus TaxID=1396 RepID=A0A2B0MUJ3_BACCE|nr:hypothetical protein COI93_04320 [Bacillus cereus]